MLIIARFLPEATLLRFKHALGHVAQGIGVVLFNEFTSRRIKQVGIGQQCVLVIIDQLGRRIEGEQEVTVAAISNAPL